MTYYTESNPTPKFDTAGGIVLCNKKLLFIYKRGMWDLPKGKIEFNHTTESTALREISEETGLKENDLTVINEKLMYYEYIIHNINSININNQDIFIKIIYDII